MTRHLFALRRMLGRLLHASLRRGWESLRQAARLHRMRQRIMRRVLVRLKHARQRQAWRAWTDAVAGQRQTELAAALAVETGSELEAAPVTKKRDSVGELI